MRRVAGDALTQVAGEEKPVRSTRAKCCEKTQLRNTYVLRFVDHSKVERHAFARR